MSDVSIDLSSCSGSNPFKRLHVFHSTLGGTTIAWEMSQGFPLVGTNRFNVYASRSGVGDWIEVTEEDVVNGYFTVDEGRHVYGVNPRLHYFVTLTTNDGQVFPSEVKNSYSSSNTKHNAYINEIIRKEELLHGKLSGTCGFLIKRRHWGDQCSACTDFNTGAVVNSDCEVCFGTGIVGGYFKPISYNVTFKGSSPKRYLTEEGVPAGTTNLSLKAARGAANVWVDPLDIWVNGSTDQRFLINSVKDVLFSDTPIAYELELRAIPTTSVEYKIEI